MRPGSSSMLMACTIYLLIITPCLSQLVDPQTGCDIDYRIEFLWKCLTVSGLNGLNGQWQANTGRCHTTMYTYTSLDHDGIYLCLLPIHNWVFTRTVCDASVGTLIARCVEEYHTIAKCGQSDWLLSDGMGGEDATTGVKITREYNDCYPTYEPSHDPTNQPTTKQPSPNPTNSPTKQPTKNPTTLSPTPPGTIICGEMDEGDYNGQIITFTVNNPIRGDIRFDASQSLFTIVTMEAIAEFGSVLLDSDIDHDGVISLQDQPAGNYTFSIYGGTQTDVEYSIVTSCTSSDPTNDPSSSPSPAPTDRPLMSLQVQTSASSPAPTASKATTTANSGDNALTVIIASLISIILCVAVVVLVVLIVYLRKKEGVNARVRSMTPDDIKVQEEHVNNIVADIDDVMDDNIDNKDGVMMMDRMMSQDLRNVPLRTLVTKTDIGDTTGNKNKRDKSKDKATVEGERNVDLYDDKLNQVDMGDTVKTRSITNQTTKGDTSPDV
eukprot:257546_1